MEKSRNLELGEIQGFLDSTNHCLVLGGPGSGKTTSALIKADRAVSSAGWRDPQQVLFLSFARSTVARIAESAGSIVRKSSQSRIEITTYHSFMWRIIRSHGYLSFGHSVTLLPPHEAAARLGGISQGLKGKKASQAREKESRRLLAEDHLLDFDLFAEVTAGLFESSEELLRIVCRKFPLVILDEFQDTNSSEYRVVKAMARHSTVVALADPDQRIYEFRGASPIRIRDFISEQSPDQFDLSAANHRSNGTDILEFANDVLSGQFHHTYEDVDLFTFPQRKGDALHIPLKTLLLKCIKRAKQRRDDWSIALLVPTKALMLTVSDYLTNTQKMGGGKELPRVFHDVAVDAEGPSLAGVAIGRLLECQTVNTELAARHLIHDVCNHIVGRKSGKPPSKNESTFIEAVSIYCDTGKVRGSNRKAFVEACHSISKDVAALTFSGNPLDDWIAIRNLLDDAPSPELRLLASDARYLRFLRKGAALRTKLNALWRQNNSYKGSTEAVRSAFIQEHFVAKSNEPRGVNVMTIHKSKGKEFDEVLIYEGVYRDRIVREQTERVVAQASLALRVAVSRARYKVSILTPQGDPCELLP